MFEAEYEVEDGYVTGSRPQVFSIDESDIETDMGEDELRELYYDMIQNDFEQRITWAASKPADRDWET